MDHFSGGRSTRYTYDFLGRLKQKNNADEGTSKYVYDKAGRLRFMIDSAGAAADPPIVLYWKYDNLGRVTEKGELVDESWGDGSTWQDYADNSPSQPSSSSSWRKRYRYDALGRLDSVLTNSDEYDAAEVMEHFGYNKFGNIVTKTVKVVSYSSSTTYTTTYSYDLLGRVKQIDLPTSKWEDVSVTYLYDQLGRVSQIGRINADPVANYTFGSSGQMATEVLNPSGGSGSKTRTFAYNAQGLLTGISNSLFSESLSYSSGGYNSNEGFYHGLIASNSVSYYAGGPSSLTYSYQYDNFGRLIVVDNTLSDMDIGVGSATTYDANGNIASIKRGTGSTQTYSYYSGTNRVQNTDGSGNDFGYNETGGVISATPKSLSAITYDAFTQMTMSETKSGVTNSYQYDANKERVYKEVSGVRTVYLHGLEDYPIMTKTSAGVEKVFVYGPTGLIAMRDDEYWYFVHKDHLGSTRLLSDESGNAVTTYDFDALGTVRRSTVNAAIQYQFTGQEFDEEVLLHNFRARMYDSDLGYFYAPDPMEVMFSPYGYVLNNPISLVDPSGLEDEPSRMIDGSKWGVTVYGKEEPDPWAFWMFMSYYGAGGGGGTPGFGGTGGFDNNGGGGYGPGSDLGYGYHTLDTRGLPPLGLQGPYYDYQSLRVSTAQELIRGMTLPAWPITIERVDIDQAELAFYDLNVLQASYAVWELSGFGSRMGEATSSVEITSGGRYVVGPIEWHEGQIVNGQMHISYSPLPGASILIHSHWTRLGAEPYPSYHGPESDAYYSMLVGLWRVVVSNEGIFGVGKKGQRRQFRGPNWIDLFR
ncbi:MAG: RHS repeat-associated core domain-containing protein [Bacteroidota bacterium]